MKLIIGVTQRGLLRKFTIISKNQSYIYYVRIIYIFDKSITSSPSGFELPFIFGKWDIIEHNWYTLALNREIELLINMSSLSDNHIQQIKRLAPFLDTHVLLNFLKNHVPGTEKLQD
jgi:hypothetical protein